MSCLFKLQLELLCFHFLCERDDRLVEFMRGTAQCKGNSVGGVLEGGCDREEL